MDESYTETPEIENTSNPEFAHEKEFRVSPVTRQFIDYLNAQPLVVEVWGSQTVMKAPGGGGGEGAGSRVVSNATIEKVEAELRAYKVLKDTAEQKLQVRPSRLKTDFDDTADPVYNYLAFNIFSAIVNLNLILFAFIYLLF